MENRESVIQPDGPEDVKAQAVVQEVEAPEAPEATEMAALQQRLQEAEDKAKEYLDGWQRARADLANFRKRAERDASELTKTANAELLRKLLPVADDFARAFQAAPGEIGSERWVEGIRLVERKLRNVLEQSGITPIEAEGQPFDPYQHEAIAREETSEFPEGTVVAELQKGYKLGDRVLRPSMVKVAVAPTNPPEAAVDAVKEFPAGGQTE